MLEINTFSISARCVRTGMLGVAVSTAVPGVGGICPFVEAGVGAVSTQSWVNPYLGIDGLALLRQGKNADEALKQLMADDPGRDVRQIGIVDAQGRSAAWTGKDCTIWFGHVTGPGYAIQGNMLVGELTIEAMARAFLETEALSLPERLVIVDELLAVATAAGDKERCVRGHAWRGEPVRHSQCLTCGECVARCPRGVLRFEATDLFTKGES